jgi:hypothetical protein
MRPGSILVVGCQWSVVSGKIRGPSVATLPQDDNGDGGKIRSFAPSALRMRIPLEIKGGITHPEVLLGSHYAASFFKKKRLPHPERRAKPEAKERRTYTNPFK